MKIHIVNLFFLQASLIKKRVSLSLLKPEMWTDDHFEVIQSFVADTTKRTMICYIDSIAGFTISLTCPVFQVEELQYFIRKEGAQITPDNIGKTLQFGKIRGNYIESLLRMMNNIYGPHFFRNTVWPESILLSCICVVTVVDLVGYSVATFWVAIALGNSI